MRRFAVRPLTGRRGDQGLTLAELSVSAAVMGVLAVVMTTVLISSSTLFRERVGHSSQDRFVSLALETMARTVRTAILPTGVTSALVSATPTSLTFYSLLNRSDALVVAGVTVPSKVELFVGTGCVRMATTPARVAGAGFAWDTGRQVVCLARTTTTPASLFTYYSSSTATSAVPVTVTGLGASDLAAVRSVQITVQLTDPQSGTLSRAESSRVTLANLVAGDLT